MSLFSFSLYESAIPMATGALNVSVNGDKPKRSIAKKVMREAARPFRRLSQRVHGTASAATPTHVEPPHVEPAVDSGADYYLTGNGASVRGFHPQQATVEDAGIPLIQKLVRQAGNHPGPIIEIGTLLGITTTNMALAKRHDQKIITVDLYCWNPWGLVPDVHCALTSQVLRYLVQTGHVEQVRMDKNDFFQAYRGPAPAMVFLDAMHDYEETKKDILWAQSVSANIISGHDYCDEFAGVKQIVDECGGPRELGGTVWVL
jgi:hypothetical protein